MNKLYIIYVIFCISVSLSANRNGLAEENLSLTWDHNTLVSLLVNPGYTTATYDRNGSLTEAPRNIRAGEVTRVHLELEVTWNERCDYQLTLTMGTGSPLLPFVDTYANQSGTGRQIDVLSGQAGAELSLEAMSSSKGDMFYLMAVKSSKQRYPVDCNVLIHYTVSYSANTPNATYISPSSTDASRINYNRSEILGRVRDYQDNVLFSQITEHLTRGQRSYRTFDIFSVKDVGKTLKFHAGVVEGDENATLHVELVNNGALIANFTFRGPDSIDNHVTYPAAGAYHMTIYTDGNAQVEINLELVDCAHCRYGSCERVTTAGFTYSYCRCGYGETGLDCTTEGHTADQTTSLYYIILKYADISARALLLLPTLLALYRGLGANTAVYFYYMCCTLITPIGQLTSLHLFDADITATLQMFSLAMTLAVTLISMARLSSPVGSTARAFSFCYVTTWACLRVAPDYVLGARYHLSSPGGQYFLLEQVCILGAVLIGVMMLMLSRVNACSSRTKHDYTRARCCYYAFVWLVGVAGVCFYYQTLALGDLFSPGPTLARFCLVVVLLMVMPNPRKAYTEGAHSFHSYDLDQSSEAPFLGNYSVKRTY